MNPEGFLPAKYNRNYAVAHQFPSINLKCELCNIYSELCKTLIPSVNHLYDWLFERILKII